MAEIKIKSNGLRNELKEIRKSIDKLTEAIVSQTNKRYEKANTNSCTCNGMCKQQRTKDGKV
jgi:predicted ATP-grasp superfamily ATP-dependent carboligase